MNGPLCGLRVVELAGLGPAPHAATVLADLGADVVRVERPLAPGEPDVTSDHRSLHRGRTTVIADLKSSGDLADLLGLIESADVLIEGFRPGVTERLGIGPDVCRERNPRLIYGRMTGWGQSGPWAETAGHDINYLAVSGVLSTIGSADEPTVPLNLIGDYGGGSMYLVTGILAALLERAVSGLGQVVDAAMVDGIGSLSQLIWALRSGSAWVDRRAANLLDGGAPFYAVYRCADGGFMAVGALEPQFYARLLEELDLDPATLPDQHDREGWPVLRQSIAAAFARRSRDQWASSFERIDACVTPVLSLAESVQHPHLIARRSHIDIDGIVQPAPAPRFSRSVSATPASPDSALSTAAAETARWIRSFSDGA